MRDRGRGLFVVACVVGVIVIWGSEYWSEQNRPQVEVEQLEPESILPLVSVGPPRDQSLLCITDEHNEPECITLMLTYEERDFLTDWNAR